MTETIGLWGLFGGTNLGNEATLAAMVATLRRRRPSARLVCISPRNVGADGHYGAEHMDMDQAQVSQYLWRLSESRFYAAVFAVLHLLSEPLRYIRTRRQLNTIDRLLIVGTGVVDDFGQSSLGLPLHLWRWCLAATSKNIPVDFVSIGIGPVKNPFARWLFRGGLRTARYCSVRDANCRDHLKQMGFNRVTDPVVPDLAFSLPIAVEAPSWPPKIIGFGVMGYSGWNEQPQSAAATYAIYRAKVETAIRRVLDLGFSVHLLVGDIRADARIVSEIVASISDCRLVAPQIESLSQLTTELGRVDFVIASRFHNLLLALLAQRPTISLGYADKCDALVQSVGFGNECQHIATFDVGQLLDDIVQLASRPAPMEQATNVVQCCIRSVETQYDAIIGCAEQ